jgi:hypothetical protein
MLEPTGPFLMSITKKSNWRNKLRAVIKKVRLTLADMAVLTRPLKHQEGEFLRPLAKDPVLWAHARPSTCGMVPEHNPVLAAAMVTSVNTQIISNNASAECSDEYAIKYVTPAMSDSHPESQLHLVSITQLHQMRKYPTKADDAKTDPLGRAARTFSQKVVNSVVGRTEHTMALMVFACLGNDSYESSDDHVFVRPVQVAKEKQKEFESCKPATLRFQATHVAPNTGVKQSLTKLQKEDNEDEGSATLFTSPNPKGVKGKKHVFVTEAQLYAYRPLDFRLYTSEEFKGAAQVSEIVAKKGTSGYMFRKGSALFNTHEVKLRRKQRTPVLGQKLPKFPGNKPTEEGPGHMSEAAWTKDMDAFAAVVVPMFSPWSYSEDCAHKGNTQGLQNLLSELDSSTASVIQKGRGNSFHAAALNVIPSGREM